MKQIILFFFLFLFFASCTLQVPEEKVLVVSIAPFSYFTSAIAGDRYNVKVIVPPGASPATFEPQPSLVREISSADALIFDGYLGYEMAWMDKFINVNKDAKVLTLANNINLIEEEEHKHSDEGHKHGIDPHFWMSPDNAAIIATSIRDLLISLDPVNKNEYVSNCDSLIRVVKETRREVETMLENSENRSFMIFHPSLTYFSRDFNLNQIAVEAEGKEPSPSALKKLIDSGTDNKIKTIFVQKGFDTRHAAVIAGEIGAEVVNIDPLSEDWPGTMLEIARLISGSINR